jgi:hypothetical protein
MAVLAAALPLLLGPSRAAAQTLSLGQAAQFGVFEVSGLNGSLHASGGTFNGNVALGNSTTYAFSGTTFNGSLYVGTGVTGSGGPTPTSMNLSTANANAISASSTAAGLTPTGTYGNITQATTFTGTGPQNVFNVSGINLSGANITINANGHSNETFVFNVANSVNMSNSSIILTNGALAGHVIFNILGGGASFSGGTFNGTILDLLGGISLSGTTVNGELLSEKQIAMSGGAVNANPFIANPEPATIIMAGLGSLLLLGRAALRGGKRRRAQQLRRASSANSGD